MFKFLFFIFFFFILLVLLMGFSVIRTIKRVLFGSGNSKQTYYKQQRNTSSNRSANGRPSGQGRRSSSDYAETEEYDETNLYKRHKKVFGKDEGEYVDYEEIK